MAKQEFTKNFGSSEYKFTPGQEVRLNGSESREWQCFRKEPSAIGGYAWVHWGKTLLPAKFTRQQIAEALV